MSKIKLDANIILEEINFSNNSRFKSNSKLPLEELALAFEMFINENYHVIEGRAVAVRMHIRQKEEE